MAFSNYKLFLSHYKLQIFKKRPGTTDRGKDYEHLYIANAILKLLKDDSIENFYISSNNETFGSFDDVVIEINHKDKDQRQIFAVQLKQSKSKILRCKDLTAPKGNFSIPEYFTDYEKNLKPVHGTAIKLVLFTNSATQIPDNILINLKNEEFRVDVVKTTQNNLLPSSERGSCYFFETEQMCKDFFQSLFLYTEQPDVNEMEKSTFKRFAEVFRCDSSCCKDFLAFITKWSVQEGKKMKLDKSWMADVIALSLLSSCVKPLTFSTEDSRNGRAITIAKVIRKFRITLLENDCYARIKNVWMDALDGVELKELNQVKAKYQLVLDYIKSKEDLLEEDKEVSKLLWLLGKCPLVVEGCLQTYEATKLCPRSFVLLTSEEDHWSGEKIFQNLSDLREDEETFNKVLRTFMFTLEGQKEASLKDLLKWNENLDQMITTSRLTQMIDEPLLVGRLKEVLPPCHVTRMLSKILIDLTFLTEITNSVVVISEVEDITAFIDLHLKGCQKLTDYSDNSQVCVHFRSNVVHLHKNKLHQEDIQKLQKQKCHHFRYISDEVIEWMRSTSNIEDLQPFRATGSSTMSIPESQLLVGSERDITIICANPGMGKSTLMKNLKTNTHSSTWTVLICARNHALHLREKGGNLDDFLRYILEESCHLYGGLDKEIVRTLFENNQVQLIWDGLDEVSDRSLKVVLSLIEAIWKKGLKQWITSRINVRRCLEERLHTLSREIKPFNESQQRLYVKQRLDLSEEDLHDIFYKIKMNVEMYSNNDILGVPLQIYILTELFKQDLQKYSQLLNSSFTLLHLYEKFVYEKFEVYFNEKRQSNRNIDEVNQNCEKEMDSRMNCYKALAYHVYLEKKHRTIFKKTFECFTNFKNFLEEIQKEKDPVGLISNVTKELVPEFSHNSYGEYFAALYLYDSDRQRARAESFVLKKKYNNIRFFLDLMLSRHSRAHVAVLCRNSIILDQCTEEELDGEDNIGRSVLEVACAWNEKRSCVEIRDEIFNSKLTVEDSLNDKKVKKLNYHKVLKMLQRVELSCDVRKILLLLPFLIPLLHSSGFCFNSQLLATMVYYAIEFDYVVIFKYVDGVPYMRDIYETFDPKKLISLAVKSKSLKCLKELICERQYGYIVRRNLEIPLMVCTFESDELFCVLLEQGINLSEFVCLVCRRGSIENVEYLHSKGIPFNVEDQKGRTALHSAFQNMTPDSLAIAQFLINLGMSVNATDVNGQTPVHCALEKVRSRSFYREPECGSFSSVKLLAATGATYKVPHVEGALSFFYPLPDCQIQNLLLEEAIQDSNNQNVVSSACQSTAGSLKSLQFLTTKGFKLDVPDVHGRLPVHYACKLQDPDTVEFVLQNSQTINTPDSRGRVSIHFACKNDYCGAEIVQMLCENGSRVDAEDANGHLPIHYACRNEDVELVSLLLDKGAKVNVPDGYGQIPIHGAAENEEIALDLVKLLIEKKTELNVRDTNGDTPLHKACLNPNLDCKLLKILISSGAEVNAANLDGQMPIHSICFHQTSLQGLKLLVEKGAQVNAISSYRCTPLHLSCARTRDSTIVEFLVAKGAEVNALDSQNQTPLHYASKNVQCGLSIVRFLMNVGTLTNVRNAGGLTPFHLACSSGGERTVNFFLNLWKNADCDDSGQGLMHHACRNIYCGIEIVRLLIDEGQPMDAMDTRNRRPIHYACENECQGYEIVKLLVERGVDINGSDIDGSTSLHLACANNEGLDIVKLLVDQNVDLEVTDVEGRLPLHLACGNGSCGYGIVKILIDRGAGMDVLDEKGRTPLHHACEKGNLKIVEALVSQNSKMNVVDIDGRLPLHFACGNFDSGTPIVKFLVNKGAKLDVPDGCNKMPLHYACESGSIETVTFLVASGVDLSPSDSTGRLPIHYASGNQQYFRAKRGHSGYQITKMLMNKGQNVHVLDKDGKTPLHYACNSGTHVTVKLLLDHGATVDVVDAKGRFPIHYACHNNIYPNFKIIKYLLDHGAKLDVLDAKGRTPLHYACEIDFDIAFKFLIFKRTEVDVPDVDGVTPLHCACAKGCRNTVKILIDRGAKDGAPDARGRMPLHHACGNKENGFSIVKLLLERGARVDVVDGEGRSPVDYARRVGNLGVERLLLAG